MRSLFPFHDFSELYHQKSERTTAVLVVKAPIVDCCRSYLQDPGCVEFADYWQNLLTARSFWDAGEEYKVG